MAIINKEQKDKRDIIIIVVVISLIIFIFLWRFIFSHNEYEYAPIATIKVAPNIDFGYLEGSQFEYFRKFEEIEPLGEEFMGRDNPFVPHSGQILQRREVAEEQDEEEERREEDDKREGDEVENNEDVVDI